MNPRPLPLLLAPLWLLVALCLLGGCTSKAHSETGGARGQATGSVITVLPAAIALPGGIPTGTLPAFPTIEPPPTPIPTIPFASLSLTGLKCLILDDGCQL
jgi:hypothetical protein